MPALKQDEYQTYVHNGNFGHIMITFWAFPYGLDNKIVIQSGVRCVQNMPKFWAHYGHILGTYMPWGHILSTWLELSKLQLRV